jgi:hypothetical protein
MNLDEETPSMDAINCLIPFQPNIAKSEQEYNPAIHDWFIYDKDIEVKSKSKNFKVSKQAWDFVEDATTSRKKTLLLYANTRVSGYTVYPETMSEEEIYNSAVELANKHSELVVEFFTADKGVQQEVAILELIHNSVITQRNGHYYDDNNYLGSNNKEVIDYLNNPANASTRDRLFKKLRMKKSNGLDNSQTQKDIDTMAAENMLDQAKVRFVDGQYQESLDIIKEAKSKMISGEMMEKLEKWKIKVLKALTGDDGEKSAMDNDTEIDLKEMDVSEIHSYFRKQGIKGWNQKMTKQELIDHYSKFKI